MKVVLIGASAGGVQSLQSVLTPLPGNFPAAIVVVQHRTGNGKSQLATLLAKRTALPVRNVHDGEPLEPGVVYVAPAHQHVMITRDQRFSCWDGARIRHVLSSANPLFESGAHVFGRDTIAVVLSGTGSNGADGVRTVKRQGGTVIAQNRETSEHFGMPEAAIKTGAVDEVLAADQIAPALIRLTQ